MTDLQEKAMRMALDALHNIDQSNNDDAIQALRQALEQPEQEPVKFNCTVVDDDHPNGVPLSQWGRQPEQEPVAWMHNFIEGNVITHKPSDIGRYPDRWTALYKDSTPCKTCQALAMAVMTDQTYHEKVVTKRGWVGLTDEEIKEGADLSRLYQDQFEPVARWAETKLKEKNHGAI